MEPAAPTMREVSVGSIILRMKFMVLEEADLMKVKMKKKNVKPVEAKLLRIKK